MLGNGSDLTVNKLKGVTDIFSNNPLFREDIGTKLVWLKELSGLKVNKKGSTSVSVHDLAIMTLESYIHSLKKVNENTTVQELIFPMTNISDTGKILIGGWRFDITEKSGLYSTIKFNEDGSIRDIVVNEKLVNNNIDAIFDYKRDEHIQSRNRWKSALTELKDRGNKDTYTKFNFFFLDTKKKPRSANELVNDFSKVVLSEDEINQVINTQLIENKDYILKEGKLFIGYDTSFNLTNNEESIYTEDNYNEWKTKKGDELTKYRDSLFAYEFKLLDRKLRNIRYNVSESIAKLNKGKYAIFNTDGKVDGKITEWNSFFKGYFYGYEIANASVQPLMNGSQNDFFNNTQRSKYTGPKNTGGTSPVTGLKYGLRPTFRLVIVNDIRIKDIVTNKEGIIGDGLMHGNPFFSKFFYYSLGGLEYGPISIGLDKSILSDLDVKTGSTTLVKHSNDVITGDKYKNGLAYRAMIKDMLDVTDREVKKINPDYDINLHNIFLHFYEQYNNFDEAVNQTNEFIVNRSGYADEIISNLVWGLQNKSGIKQGASYINTYNPEDLERQPLTSTIHNSENLKIILNPAQDIDKINNLTMMNQILSYVGIDNPLLSKAVQSSLKKLAEIGEDKMKREFDNITIDSHITEPLPVWVAKMDKYLRKKGMRLMAEMATIGYFGDILSDNEATLQQLATKTRLLQIHRNSITKDTIKVPMTGVRFVQSSGFFMPLYVEDATGIPYQLVDIEKRLGRMLEIGEVVPGFTPRRLGTMMPDGNGIKKAQILAPNVYAKKFGMRMDETLNDGFSITLLDGTKINLIREAIKVCAVKSPGFGDEKNDILQDIAILTGGRVISKDKDDKLEDVTLMDLGSAKKIKVTKEETLIIEGKGDKKEIDKRVKIHISFASQRSGNLLCQ